MLDLWIHCAIITPIKLYLVANIDELGKGKCHITKFCECVRDINLKPAESKIFEDGLGFKIS